MYKNLSKIKVLEIGSYQKLEEPLLVDSMTTCLLVMAYYGKDKEPLCLHLANHNLIDDEISLNNITKSLNSYLPENFHTEANLGELKIFFIGGHPDNKLYARTAIENYLIRKRVTENRISDFMNNSIIEILKLDSEFNNENSLPENHKYQIVFYPKVFNNDQVNVEIFKTQDDFKENISKVDFIEAQDINVESYLSSQEYYRPSKILEYYKNYTEDLETGKMHIMSNPIIREFN